MDSGTIILKIEKGLQACGLQNGIEEGNVRFRLIGTKDLNCYLYDGNKPFATDGKATKVDIKKAFGLSTLENLFVEPYLKKTLKELATKNNLDQDSVSAFIYKKEKSIAVNVLEGNKTIKELTINEFLNK